MKVDNPDEFQSNAVAAAAPWRAGDWAAQSCAWAAQSVLARRGNGLSVSSPRKGRRVSSRAPAACAPAACAPAAFPRGVPAAFPRGAAPAAFPRGAAPRARRMRPLENKKLSLSSVIIIFDNLAPSKLFSWNPKFDDLGSS
jgi:hypothetical protein